MAGTEPANGGNAELTRQTGQDDACCGDRDHRPAGTSLKPSDESRAASNSRIDGAGLGLTIAARLLRNQGGTIDAANAPPRGAILTLRLPRRVA